ncbi:FAD-dependent oxidoreductase [Accumulibacter sp.]|uniref:FAD-dependent oxidoreductase n=1 Tax=Accumulibacter sp. TaxID=2053492 RepID=UPI0025DA4C6E|nr:FAD-dependent oxidoreductase [Accumulibacter sp.]MCM8625372.1 FAD-dependent oxidoreductase [Accumulibacter sp.]
MPGEKATVVRDVVLVGGGHSHLGVLRCLARQPLAGVRLTLISIDSHTPYSGMLPGYVAGHYRYEQTLIDLRCLARYAGARCYVDEVIGIDRESRLVLCRDRPPVSYDMLSINIGSTPHSDAVPGAAEYATPVKPIARFNERWLRLLDRVRSRPAVTTFAVVGAGAGGVEMILAMQHRLRCELRALRRSPDDLRFHLLSASAEILPRHNAGVRRCFDRLLAERNVIVHRAAVVTRVLPGSVGLSSGDSLAIDEVVWVTQAGGAPWLRESALSLDGSGFIEVRNTLQTVSDPLIFAAGDCAALVSSPLEKSGVFAVRQGEVLAANLRRLAFGQPLQDYRPQPRCLALIGTGDEQAVASRGGMYARGHWVWLWKSWIDRRFMGRLAMRSAGSGASATGSPMADLDEAQTSEARCVLAGCCLPAGWAVPATRDGSLDSFLGGPGGGATLRTSLPPDTGGASAAQAGERIRTVDFLVAPVDDPWLFGRMAAAHVLSEFFARGGEAQAAQILVVVPPGCERKIAGDVAAVCRGVDKELQASGCALTAVRTVSGNEFAVVLVTDGRPGPRAQTWRLPAGIREGDVLMVNKPIGIPTLLAAHRRFPLPGRYIDEALRLLVESNQGAASCFREHGATACIRLEGFGLPEQLTALVSRVGLAAEIDTAAVPVADGAAMALALLLPCGSRQDVHRVWGSPDRNPSEPAPERIGATLFRMGLTAGGLLASVPGARAAGCLRALRALGYTRAASIGRVRTAGSYPEHGRFLISC